MLNIRHICIAFAIMYSLSCVGGAAAFDILFSGQLKNRGVYRDTSWWNKDISHKGSPFRRGIYSNFWNTNLTSFQFSRRNQAQNSPLSETQPYNDQNIAGRNLYGNASGGILGNLPDPNNEHSSASWIDSRALLGIKAVINENIRGVFLLQFGQYDWGSAATGVGTNNEPLLVNNAYVEFKNLLSYAEDSEIVVGLAPIKIGHGVLLQDDMALLENAINSKYGRFMIFAATAAENFRTDNDDDDYYGGSIGVELEHGYVEVFTVWQRSLRDRMIGISFASDGTPIMLERFSNTWMSNVGLSGDLKFDLLSVSFEGIWQQGRFRTSSSHGMVELNAFFGYLDVSVDMDIAKAGLAGLYASGNKKDYETDARDGLNMFYAISPTDSYDRCVLNWDELFVREVLVNNLSNIISPKWYVTATPFDNVSITLQNQWYWKAASPPGSGPYRGNFIGKSVDIIAGVNIYNQLAWRLTGSYMWTEDEVFGPSSDNLWQLRQALTYTF